jgi:chromatin remodeling complex protein RSC6
VETHDEVNLTSRVTALAEKVNNLRSVMAAIYSEVKVLEKAVPRELKKAQKGGRRARKAAATEGGEAKPKKETVFTRPTAISDALCTFLGVAKGTLISRSEVTSRVCKYAKDKGLMEKKTIKADAALRKLLALKEGDELQILNLQRYLKIHYPAPKPAATA